MIAFFTTHALYTASAYISSRHITFINDQNANKNQNHKPEKHNRTTIASKLKNCESLLDRTEVRQEAVQQALAALKNRPKPSLPMPSKRSSVLNRSPDRDRDDTGNVFGHLQTKNYCVQSTRQESAGRME